jgi:FkbM family methyltransferase
MASGQFEPEETRIVLELLREVDVLVNVGANVGYYCLHALSQGKEVIAIEPIARNLHYLLKNIAANGWARNAEVFPIAVGRETDVLQMWGGWTGASLVKGWADNPESYVRQVPILTLDRIVGDSHAEKRLLVLMDIEGAEYQALQGALRTLGRAPRPIWFIEVVSTEHQPGGVTMNPHFGATFDLFFERGYRAYAADASGREYTRERIAELVLRPEEVGLHNFVFR